MSKETKSNKEVKKEKTVNVNKKVSDYQSGKSAASIIIPATKKK